MWQLSYPPQRGIAILGGWGGHQWVWSWHDHPPARRPPAARPPAGRPICGFSIRGLSHRGHVFASKTRFPGFEFGVCPKNTKNGMNQVQMPPFELKLRQHGATPPRTPPEPLPPPKTLLKIQKKSKSQPPWFPPTEPVHPPWPGSSLDPSQNGSIWRLRPPIWSKMCSGIQRDGSLARQLL